MITRLGIKDFLNMSPEIPVIDVRSPGEYEKGHITGAYNIPLFNDKERSEIGKKYKKESREASVYAGLKYAGPKLAGFAKRAKKIANNNEILVHCWRGGMRSESMAWLFSVAGIRAYVLEGGYRAYRQYFYKKLSEDQKIVILGGMTGSAKTEILYELKKIGQQIIDLEGLANHKGSAFGGLGQGAQPTTEQFINNLFDVWKELDPRKFVWIEDESKNIGSVSVPDLLYKKIRTSPLVIVEMKRERRVRRLQKEYAGFDPEKLEQSIIKIQKRLGGLRTKKCLRSIKEKEFAQAIELSLDYYDKTYRYGIEKRHNNIVEIHKVNDKPVNLIARDILNSTRRKLGNDFSF